MSLNLGLLTGTAAKPREVNYRGYKRQPVKVSLIRKGLFEVEIELHKVVSFAEYHTQKPTTLIGIGLYRDLSKSPPAFTFALQTPAHIFNKVVPQLQGTSLTLRASVEDLEAAALSLGLPLPRFDLGPALQEALREQHG